MKTKKCRKQNKQPTRECEIIVAMRAALDLLKGKWQEAQGPWAMVEFMDAALHPEKGSWILTIVDAEKLSQPYVDTARRAARRGK